jgi:hypothetical protein
LPIHPAAPAATPVDLTGKVWYSAAEAAAYLGYKDAKTVRRAHLDGRLQGRRAAPTTPGSRGGNLGFRREWLDRFREGLPPLDAAPAHPAAS